MELQAFTSKHDLEQIKSLITDLSVDTGSKENGFVNYPVQNIDLFENLILDSDLCYGSFDQEHKLNWCMLSYPVQEITDTLIANDELLTYIKSNYPDSIYADIVWITREVQRNWRWNLFLAELYDRAMDRGYKSIVGVVVMSPHRNDISMNLLKSLGWRKAEMYDANGLTFWIYKIGIPSSPKKI